MHTTMNAVEQFTICILFREGPHCDHHQKRKSFFPVFGKNHLESSSHHRNQYLTPTFDPKKHLIAGRKSLLTGFLSSCFPCYIRVTRLSESLPLKRLQENHDFCCCSRDKPSPFYLFRWSGHFQTLYPESWTKQQNLQGTSRCPRIVPCRSPVCRLSVLSQTPQPNCHLAPQPNCHLALCRCYWLLASAKYLLSLWSDFALSLFLHFSL
jgi:hypothetical protein